MHVHTAGENLIVRRVVLAYNCSILSLMKATCIAQSNLALIKYWGNRDDALRLPATNSISFNLDGARTTTSVEFAEGAHQVRAERSGGARANLRVRLQRRVGRRAAVDA